MNKEIYKNNLKAIKTVYPDFATWIEKEKDVDWFSLIRSKNGDYNATVKAGMETVPIYDMDNARKPAREIAKNYNLYNNEVTVLIGMGLGHVLKQFIDKMEKEHILVVIEPIVTVLKHAFHVYDFSHYILNRQLLICVTADDFSVFCSLITNRHVVQEWAIFVEWYTLKKELEYKLLTDQIVSTINTTQCNTGTVIGAGIELALNDIQNLPYVIRHRGIDELTNLFKGKPAVIVSTGPSLKKNIHLLQAAQDRIIIVATMQSLRILLSYGITPDFVCTVDYGKVNMGHFKGLMDSGVPLVALNRCYAPILKEWQGTKFIVGTPLPGYEETGLAVISKKGSVDQGGSVSHTCMGTAIKLGCNPITVIGQDLALGESSHFKQADESGDVFVDEKGIIQWKVTDPRSHLYPGTYSMGPAVYVPGYFGGSVLTNLGLKSFITNFENMFRFHPDKKFINCTEGGAKIKYSKEMTFEKFLGKYCKEVIHSHELLEPFLSFEENYKESIDKTIPKLENDMQVFDIIIKNAKKALDEITIIEGTTDVEKLKAALNKNQDYAIIVQEACKKEPLIQLYIYHENVEIQNRELKVKGKQSHLLKNEEDRATRIKRSKLILTAASKGAEELKKEYEKTLIILKKYAKTKDEKLLSNWEDSVPSLKDAEEFFKAGNFARPLLDAQQILKKKPKDKTALGIERKALDMRNEIIKTEIEEAKKDRRDDLIQYCYCLEEGQKMGRDKKDFDKALKLLKKASKLFPERWEARWGLATTYTMLRKDKESLEQFDKLVETHPKELQFQFERGLVLLKIDSQKGFEELRNVMKDTDQFDSFLIKLGDLYTQTGMVPEAQIAFEEYTKKFPADMQGWNCLLNNYRKQGKTFQAEAIKKRVQRMQV